MDSASGTDSAARRRPTPAPADTPTGRRRLADGVHTDHHRGRTRRRHRSVHRAAGRAGADRVAIEPDIQMRSRLAATARCHVLDGTAERIPLGPIRGRRVLPLGVALGRPGVGVTGDRQGARARRTAGRRVDHADRGRLRAKLDEITGKHSASGRGPAGSRCRPQRLRQRPSSLSRGRGG